MMISLQVVQSFQLGGSEDEMLQDIDIAKANANAAVCQQNPSMGTALAETVGSSSRSSTGKIKDVKFLDLEVAQVQLTTQHNLVNGTSSAPPNAEHATALRGHRSVSGQLASACMHGRGGGHAMCVCASSETSLHALPSQRVHLLATSGCSSWSASTKLSCSTC